MVDFSSLPQMLAQKRVAAYAAIVALGGAVGGYAIHEHHTAQNLATHDEQTTAALNATRSELNDLTAKVNTLVSRSETPPAPSAPSPQVVAARRPVAPRRHSVDPHLKRLQSQIDAPGKAIEQTRTELASTQGDLVNTRTELTGSIAHTHDELVLLQKKGERNYTEFDLSKSKQFQREEPFGIRLKKANNKHQYADLELMVDDRNLSQKHVNLYQPVMFYTPDSPQPVEVVINDISKDHIHGYVSAPKYRQSELASMSSAGGTNATPDQDQGTTSSSEQPSPRKKLPPPH
jgi:hypothetical protein